MLFKIMYNISQKSECVFRSSNIVIQFTHTIFFFYWGGREGEGRKRSWVGNEGWVKKKGKELRGVVVVDVNK